jgi:hypothetical protein
MDDAQALHTSWDAQRCAMRFDRLNPWPIPKPDVGAVGRRRHMLHHGVKRDTRCPLKPPFVGFGGSAHGSHSGLIFRTAWMECGPLGRAVIFEKCDHDVSPVRRLKPAWCSE